MQQSLKYHCSYCKDIGSIYVPAYKTEAGENYAAFNKPCIFCQPDRIKSDPYRFKGYFQG